LPTIYSYRFFIKSGGLASYGFEGLEQFQAAATYADRILRGAKPGERCNCRQIPAGHQSEGCEVNRTFEPRLLHLVRRRGDRAAASCNSHVVAATLAR
jgi:hypothetical protein